MLFFTTFSREAVCDNNNYINMFCLFLILMFHIYNFNTGWPKKKNRIHIFLTEIHKFNSSLLFFFRIWSRFCAWKIWTIVFTNMSWSTKEKNLELFCFIFVEVIKSLWVLGFFLGGVTLYIRIFKITKGFLQIQIIHSDHKWIKRKLLLQSTVNFTNMTRWSTDNNTLSTIRSGRY